MMFITLSSHGEDELVQLKDEQSDRCWVDVPTQAAPDLRPTRTLQLVAQLAHHQPLHLLHCWDVCLLEGDEPFTNTGSLPRYHDVHYPHIFTFTFYQIFREFTTGCLARHTVSVHKHSTQLSFRFIPAILEIRVSCHPSKFLTEKVRIKNPIGRCDMWMTKVTRRSLLVGHRIFWMI